MVVGGELQRKARGLTCRVTPVATVPVSLELYIYLNNKIQDKVQVKRPVQCLVLIVSCVCGGVGAYVRLLS